MFRHRIDRFSGWNLLFSIALSCFACGSRPELDSVRGSGESDAAEGAGGSSPTGGPGTGGSSGGDPGTCASSCTAAAGQVSLFSSSAEAHRALAGRWQICPGGEMTSLVRPRDAIGIELEMTTVVSDKASKGNLYFLVAGADGPIRGNGANYQSAYDLFLPEPSTRVMILMKNPPTSGGSIRYSQCPRLMEMSGSSPGADFVLAPF